ncbi:MAG: ATP-dependent zinc metalloprotease FtsH [Actinomycetia bacterium]|nr:ATP-dependent zinc metalloprotease FtsH [Actinomycetes bacterium]
MDSKKKNLGITILYLAGLIVMIAIVANRMNNANTPPTKLSTGAFVTAAKAGRIKSAEFRSSTGSLSGQYWATAKDKNEEKAAKKFTSTWAGNDSFMEFAQKNLQGKFKVDNSDSSGLLWSIGQIVLMVALVGGLFFFITRMQGGNARMMNFGRARTKATDPQKQKVTFKDVAGEDEAVAELGEIKDFLSAPEHFQALGAKIPKGVLLVGPPGTGKTLLARAVAGEADVPFFSISGSDFVEMFVGVGASRVRDLFEQAKAAAPAIIFVDEIDAVGRQRGTGLGGGHDEREQTLNALLVEMDGFDPQDNVIMIAATNRPDVLDPALLRPGRFDRQVIVDRPDLRGREEILKIHATNKPLAEEVDLGVIARRTPGFTGADLSNLLNEAALLAARGGKKKIGQAEIEEGSDRVMMGPERKSRLISDAEKRTIAYHESGHAIVGHRLPNSDPVHKVTIIPRGGSLGSTWSLPTEDRFLQSKAEMLDDIAVLLAGRASEEMAIGDITTGASNDIERASKLARDMVTRFGMSETLGPRAFGEQGHDVFLGRDLAQQSNYGNETAAVIDTETAHIIDEGFNKARKILKKDRAMLDLMAQVLIERETLEGDALKAIFEGRWDAYVDAEQAQDQKSKDATPRGGAAVKPEILPDLPLPPQGSVAPAGA